MREQRLNISNSDELAQLDKQITICGELVQKLQVLSENLPKLAELKNTISNSHAEATNALRQNLIDSYQTIQNLNSDQYEETLAKDKNMEEQEITALSPFLKNAMITSSTGIREQAIAVESLKKANWGRVYFTASRTHTRVNQTTYPL